MKTSRFQSGMVVSVALTVFALFLCVPSAYAIMTKATMPQLTEGAASIVKGHVVEVRSAWDDGGKTIFTYTTIVVDRWLKGAGPDAVTVRTIGGEVGDIGLWVEDMPVFVEGQEVITFLVPGENEPFMSVKGLFQGKFTVEDGKVIEAGLPVVDFVNMVSSIVKAQEKKLNER